ncbi:unnamed protein product [Symbiodinium natans]|uniref:Uncharacterized protein n=1 Tax=Symbiodinium natans TaxID=878477 RepID=A0A812RDJ8_9DINO|nr:unnamed protein product [Symbiodinium natans]
MCKGSAEFVNGARRETCVARRGVTECADMRSLMFCYESAMRGSSCYLPSTSLVVCTRLASIGVACSIIVLEQQLLSNMCIMYIKFRKRVGLRGRDWQCPAEGRRKACHLCTEVRVWVRPKTGLKHQTNSTRDEPSTLQILRHGHRSLPAA